MISLAQGHWAAEMVNHLWQSTLFVAGVWLLTLALRRNQAQTRYKLWLMASVKFLIPFSLLIAAGERVQLKVFSASAQTSSFSGVMQSIAEPYAADQKTANVYLATPSADSASPVQHRGDALPLVLAALWACGCLTLFARWGRSWWQLRAAVRSASPLMPLGDVPVLSTSTPVEPGVFGILRPVLLLPAGITGRLSTPQMDAIFAHELCHVRRRDNLAAAAHMLVEGLFWFHPAVWWIGARLVDERERACDEAVLESNRDALVYAEGILNVCKFYVEAPLTCVSGVTGADLKKRIVRIMAEQAARKLDLGRKLMLGFAALLAVALPVVFGLVHASAVHAQAAAKTGIEDTWQGTLHTPEKDLRTVLKITKTDAGTLKATMYSIDQGGQPIGATTVTFDGSILKYSIEMIDLTYEGKLSADGKSITGSSKQGPNSLPLVFERATPATEWAIPEPPPKVPPMAASADPAFEVATIKPSKPDEPGKLFGWRGDRFKGINLTLGDLIGFAYDVQAKQVTGGPDWMDTVKFDVDAQPDTPGSPSRQQLKTMVQKLLADRFQLKFHRDKKELSAYVLTVAKSGSKMKKSEGDPNGLPGLFFRELGVLTVRNATMADFSHLMQTAVLDRPVVDQTGLDGKWDFLLKWTPDESQFSGMGVKVPPPSNAADAPPPLFTAIQEQIGLKLEAAKAPVEVLVLDHVEKPSAN